MLFIIEQNFLFGLLMFFTIVSLCAVGFICHHFYWKSKVKTGKHEWAMKHKNAAYSHWENYKDELSGIAIYPDDKSVVLLGHFKKSDHEKRYNFSEIRSWRYNKIEPGKIVGGGLQGMSMNGSMKGDALRNSGFFISVADVDHPEWQIRFLGKEAEREMKRWMEIFAQNLKG